MLLFFALSWDRISPRQTKVAYPESTVRIDKEVSRLEVSVDDIGRVEVSCAPEDLGHEVLQVCIRQTLSGADDLGEICLAGRENEVDLGKVHEGGVKVEEGGDVVAAAEMSQDGDFSEGPTGEHIPIKDASHLLDRYVAIQDFVTT